MSLLQDPTVRLAIAIQSLKKDDELYKSRTIDGRLNPDERKDYLETVYKDYLELEEKFRKTEEWARWTTFILFVIGIIGLLLMFPGD